LKNPAKEKKAMKAGRKKIIGVLGVGLMAAGTAADLLTATSSCSGAINNFV